ncbi:tRNA (guanosine(46)-N7)-methyltransferase TrmB [Mangrovibacillus cuniculi]|uniref:tRNA (guanine-N(7)-)-methyltransferase n=1 Tax=Mangrovibacillus cuniculi TaxID=2593652 RepID=A0A7S8HFX4_9BACI|nr:tRNA (guanosine(46)-N7)-methyltransferase TrmB [Mangrovibacillus cuniculi]QPC47273.1 tRNA (guanosine(46)-N7)-methyltransferase TrmB [Mangrovibacillus cuniculi]
MRLRHKPWASDFLQEHNSIAISNPFDYKGKWKELFGNDHPIHIEVGTGKGQFLAGMAKANPEVNYIGIEMYESVIVSAVQKVIDEDIPNFKLINIDARELTNFFADGEIGRVYLNFSDPWPKTRHEKRRLTHKSFLDLYKQVLVDGGELHFKTDNQGLFEYSLKSFSWYGLSLNWLSLDLHKSDIEGNIMTEYEEKFSSQGYRIYRVEAKFPSEK